MPIQVRPATRADIETIVAFNLAMALETEGKSLDREVLHTGVRAIFDDPGKGVCYVAEIDGEIAGSLMITTEWSDWENQYYWWIQSVYVIPDARGMGIYKALYRYVYDLARSGGQVRGFKLYVERNNLTAKKVYEALGMNRADHDIYETPGSLGDDPPKHG
ncbi:MAG: GNAT family N-acetyltransferase [Candidatus Latescibacterota bacterium]|nr:MAG: GNAT family N-acetyltransferase [Candidatus Latescibacterota bacterium]